MSSLNQRAQEARERGNSLYKALRINDAIEAYKLAASFVPSDPAPLSNLSAASFEVGDYENCARYSTEALALLEETTNDDPRKQKLLTRLTKARRYHFGNDDSIDRDLLRNSLLRLPRYRPHLSNERSYYACGHDVPESQYGRALRATTKDAPVVSFMFCGIGDARNMLQTMMSYHLEGPKSCQSHQRLHFTILDFKPAILARDLILFALLDDISQNMGASQDLFDSAKPPSVKFIEALTVASYFYVTPVMPAYAWNRIHATIERLLDCFDNSEQPISWVHIPVVVQATVRPTLECWKQGPGGPYSTERFRELVKQDNSQAQMHVMSMFGDLGPDPTFPHLKSERRLYKDISVILPHPNLLNTHDPELVTILQDYRKKSTSAKERLSAHINSQWKPNFTLADIVCDNENAIPERMPHPDMSLSPFDLVGSLITGWLGEPGASSFSGNTLMTIADSYFIMIGKAMASLRDRLMVEVCFGEMANCLENMQYQTVDRFASESESKDCLLSKWPHKYHVIHMSNIPDYVGGPLTTFLSCEPILEYGPGTGLTSCNLRNPPQFKTLDHFLSEYVVMYDRHLLKSHFHLQFSAQNPDEAVNGPMPSMHYTLWERFPQSSIMSFEQLMPQDKFLHWLHSHFLKLCLPFPRSKGDGDPTMVFAPLNLTAFLRLVMHVSELGYPAHWISNLMESILSGQITTTARPPPRQVLTPKDVDTVHQARSFCTFPWVLEFATLTGLWRSLLRVGLVIPSAVPCLGDMIQYTIKFPGVKVWDAICPHSMLVFYDEHTFGPPPRNLRSILMDDSKDSSPKSRALKERGLRCISTFHWRFKAQEATFWISRDAFEEMKAWNVSVWRIDAWEKVGQGVKLGKAVVRERCWGEWEDPPEMI